MTAKWISGVIGLFLHNPVGDDWIELQSRLERINNLLRESMQHVNDDNLYDRIREEIEDVPN